MQKLCSLVCFVALLALTGCGGGTNSLNSGTPQGNVGDGGNNNPPNQTTLPPTPTGNNTVTITWTPPTRTLDGNVLNDLAGYEILYGSDRNALLSKITINNPGAASYDVSGIGSGPFYFVVRGFNTAGVKAPYSNVATITI